MVKKILSILGFQVQLWYHDIWFRSIDNLDFGINDKNIALIPGTPMVIGWIAWYFWWFGVHVSI